MGNYSSLLCKWSLSVPMSPGARGWYYIRHGLGLNHDTEGKLSIICLLPYEQDLILDIHETMQPLDLGSDPQHVTEACSSHSNPLLMNSA